MQLLWLNQSHFCAASSLSPRAPCLLLGLCWAHGETSEGWHHLCTALQIWKGKGQRVGLWLDVGFALLACCLGLGLTPPPPASGKGLSRAGPFGLQL